MGRTKCVPFLWNSQKRDLVNLYPRANPLAKERVRFWLCKRCRCQCPTRKERGGSPLRLQHQYARIASRQGGDERNNRYNQCHVPVRESLVNGGSADFSRSENVEPIESLAGRTQFQHSYPSTP